MGLLTGKFLEHTPVPPDDVRSRRPEFQAERAARLAKLEQIRPVLTEGGRTLAQGALGWLWARSKQTIPILGFKTIARIEENVAALRFGPLADEQMRRIAQTLNADEPMG